MENDETDEQHTTLIYGNRSIDAGTLDRPRVSFLQLAYNQEKFIHEAVNGAFLQTYEPLQIILSDDGSTDRTFQIMKDMAAAYVGPHMIVVRRNNKNMGTYSNILQAAKHCVGTLVILAGGDDISKPARTTKIVDASRSSDAWAFQSRYDLIDENGNIIKINQKSEDIFSSESEFYNYFYADDGKIFVAHGATLACKRELLDISPVSDKKILSEDGVFTLILNMIRKEILDLDESLVLYRTHPKALTNWTITTNNISIEKCRNILIMESRQAKNILDRAGLALIFKNQNHENIRSLDTDYLKNEFIIQNAKCNWNTLSYKERMSAMFSAAKYGKIGYIIPSIIGVKLQNYYLYMRYKVKNISGI